jgi:CubicO group peptidase (beta-lactamase class C family)
MTIDSDWLAARLAASAQKHNVPGASAAVSVDGEVIAEAATGVLSVRTGVEATTDSIFQIGSISKVYTATLVMQLVDEDIVALDDPVTRHLPELRLADEAAADRVTIRQLLSHTSGIDGDCFNDTGRGDDCVERYVEGCASLHMTHEPGETMSYCNTGYVLLGRIVEKHRGDIWDRVLKDRLLRPIGAKASCTLPEDAVLRRAAVGHIHQGKEAPVATKTWLLPRSMGPAGLISAPAREVLAFAQLHLDGGVATDGTRLLSAASVHAMQETQVEVPDPHTLGDRWGLGWILFEWSGHELFGHDGGTIGQSAFLRILPSRNAAVVLLTNGGMTDRLYHSIVGDVFEALAGFRVPPPLTAPATRPAIDTAVVAGVYGRLGVRTEVGTDGDRLRATISYSGDLAALELEPVQTLTLEPVDQLTYLARSEKGGDPVPVVFYDVADGRARFVHFGARACRRVG